MRTFVFVTDSGRKSEGLRTTQIVSDNLVSAIRAMGIDDADHHQQLTDANGKGHHAGVYFIRSSSASDVIAVIYDLGERK